MTSLAWSKYARQPEPSDGDGDVHARRIQDELREAGATMYGLAKFSSQYLYRLIHANEHIRGIVYGRYRGGKGLLKFNEGMLVATDRRIIFLDYKPGFTSVEEIAYRAISGIDYVAAGPFSSVTLHTRIGSFTIRYANATCIRTFAAYVGGRQIEEREPVLILEPVQQTNDPSKEVTITSDARTFLNRHNIAVISTVGQNGQVHGAAVHYVLDDSGAVYIITKPTTCKAQNMLANRQAALTVYDAERMQTVQMHGRAALEKRAEVQAWAMNLLCPPRTPQQSAPTPQSSGLAVFFIQPDTVRFIDFALKEREMLEAQPVSRG